MTPWGFWGKLVEGEWDRPITWISPRSISEQTWFSRLMSGVGRRRHAVEFDVFPGELVAPRGFKAIYGHHQQVIPGTVSLAGRKSTFKVLRPNYLGYVAEGTVYAELTAAAAYGAYKAYQAIAPDSSSATQQSSGHR